MVLGMPLATFTFLHVLVSLVGIASGLIVLERFFRNRTLGVSNVVYRPLPELAFASALVAGAWLDPEGQPQLMLDPEELVAMVLRSPSAMSARPGFSPIVGSPARRAM